jgi:hypothetical protein
MIALYIYIYIWFSSDFPIKLNGEFEAFLLKPWELCCLLILLYIYN